MGYFVDTFRALRTTLTNAFREPVTSEFPIVIRPRGERYRVSFALPDDEHGELACIGCLACERICPSQVITMKATPKIESPVTGKKRAYVDEFVLDLSGCIVCELCIQVCGSDAITMVRQPEAPAFHREDLVLDLAKLRANSKDKPESWGKGTILLGSQEPPKAEKARSRAALKARVDGSADAQSEVTRAEPASGSDPTKDSS